MSPQEIKDRMREKGLTQAQLEKRFRVSHTTISFLIHKKMKSDKLERRLARALGVSLDELRANGQCADAAAVQQ